MLAVSDNDMAEPPPEEEKKKNRRKYTLRKKKSKKKKLQERQELSQELGEPHSSPSFTDTSDEATYNIYDQHDITRTLVDQHQQQHQQFQQLQQQHQQQQQQHRQQQEEEGGVQETDHDAEKDEGIYDQQLPKTHPPPNVAPVAYTPKKNGKVQYAVNEKGESVQFSINQKGIPELWLQVDHAQCLVSPLTVNSSAYPHSFTQSLSSGGIISSSKKNIMLKTSLLSIGEKNTNANQQANQATPEPLMGASGEDSDGTDERFLSQYQHLNVNVNEKIMSPVVRVSPKVKMNKDKGKKKKKKKDKKKKPGERWDIAGDEAEQGARTQGNSVVPSTKIPNLERRSSVRIPSSSKPRKKSSSKIKKSDKSGKKKESKTPKAEEEDELKLENKSSTRRNSFPPPPSEPSQQSQQSEKSTQKVLTRSASYKTYSHNGGHRMDVTELRERFGSQRNLHTDQEHQYHEEDDSSAHVEKPTELKAYALPAKVKPARPGLPRKGYQMSERSLQNLDPESADDDEEDNLLKYINSSYKMDL